MGLLYADGQLQAILVIVRLAHDRRFVGGVVLFVVIVFVFIFIRISGRHRVAHDHEGISVDQLGEEFLGMYCFMLLLLGCGPRYFTFLLRFSMITAAPLAGKAISLGLH